MQTSQVLPDALERDGVLQRTDVAEAPRIDAAALEFWVVRVLWSTSRRRDFVGENGERPGVRRGGGRSRCPHQLKGVLEAAGVAFVEESGGGAGVRLKNDPAPSAIRSRA